MKMDNTTKPISESDELIVVDSLSVFSKSDFSLRASDPRKLLNLCASLDEQDVFELQKKVNNYIQSVTGAKTAVIINLASECQEAVIQVIGNNILEQEYRFGLPQSVLNEAVLKKQPIDTKISDLDKELLKILSDNDIHTFLNIPIENIQRHIVLLCCIIDYKSVDQTQCVCLVTECFRYCVGTIVNTLAYEDQKRLHLSCRSLLSGARNLISHLGDVSDLLREVMTEARRLTKAERCSLFLLDEQGNLVSKVFDGVRSSEKLKEVKIKAGQGIAGHVAQTGTLLNIKDAYAHPLFYKEVDLDTGFHTRNILCFPIMDDSRVIGVAQLCNKMDTAYFDLFDEEVAMAFSVYCGISIMHSLVYKKIQAAQARNKLSNELMMYYMKVREEEVEQVIEHKSEIEYKDLEDLSFIPRNVPQDDIPSLSLRMFEEMGFIEHFNIPVRTLARFIMYAKKGYRNMPYHNWSHAFAVHHFVFLMLKKGKIIEKGHLTPLEGLALLVSGMCHDIDHRGTTNQFQLLQDNNSLAKLYSSEGSVMERHHVSQTMCLLNTEGCNIVAHLDESVFKHFIDLISQMILGADGKVNVTFKQDKMKYTTSLDKIEKHNVIQVGDIRQVKWKDGRYYNAKILKLATDMVVHLRILEEEKKMISNGFDVRNERHKYLLQCIMISCADMSDQTKNFEMSRKVAVLIYEEFFKQGDLEKAMGVNPSEMMDRDKANVPELQVGFLSGVVIPLFEVLVALYPEMVECLDNVCENLLAWNHSISFFQEEFKKGRSSIDILSDPELDTAVNDFRLSRASKLSRTC